MDNVPENILSFTKKEIRLTKSVVFTYLYRFKRDILEQIKVAACFMECKNKTLYLCINTKGGAITLRNKPIFMSLKTGAFCYESPFFIYWIQSSPKSFTKELITPD